MCYEILSQFYFIHRTDIFLWEQILYIWIFRFIRMYLIWLTLFISINILKYDTSIHIYQNYGCGTKYYLYFVYISQSNLSFLYYLNLMFFFQIYKHQPYLQIYQIFWHWLNDEWIKCVLEYVWMRMDRFKSQFLIRLIKNFELKKISAYSSHF